MATRRYYIPSEEFVRQYMIAYHASSDNVTDVLANHFDVPRLTIANKINRLRRAGVQLPRSKTGRKSATDAQQLNDLISQMNK